MSTIERAEVFVASPGRNFVTLQITTADGVTGLGDATLNGRELAVASYLRDHVVPLLIGRDPARIEDIWQYLYRGAYWRRGPVTMTAIAAVDTALWDIKGKVAGLPVYQLLGGRSRDGVHGLRPRQRHGRRRRCSTTSPGSASSATRRSARRPRCPDSAARYGVAQGQLIYEPADAVAARRAALVDRGVPELRARPPATRCASGSASTSTCCTTCTTGSRRSRRPGSARSWSTAGCSGWRTRPRRRTRRRSGSSASTRRRRSRSARCFNSIWDCQQLITEQLIDYIRTTVVHAGRHHAPAADLRPRRALPRPHRLARRDRPLAGLHGRRAAPRPGGPELRHPGVHGRTPTRRRRCSAPTSTSRTGCWTPGEVPGLGVEYDEKAAERFPYEPRYLPVARRLDGSVHDW